MIVFDTTTLLVALAPPEKVQASVNGQPIVRARERVDYLIRRLNKGEKILIPTPVLAEGLVRAGREAAEQFVERINKSAAFEIADFDALAAIDAAELTEEAIREGRAKFPGSGPHQKVKVDRQIVAIAKSRGCKTIYSNDGDIERIGAGVGIEVIGIHNLPLPPPEMSPVRHPIIEYIEQSRTNPG